MSVDKLSKKVSKDLQWRRKEGGKRKKKGLIKKKVEGIKKSISERIFFPSNLVFFHIIIILLHIDSFFYMVPNPIIMILFKNYNILLICIPID